MERFVRGDVVVLPFPYSDLSSAKRRPALIIGVLGGVDLLVCQITSIDRPPNSHSIKLTSRNMKEGQLSKDSWIRPERIFAADSRLIIKRVGAIDDETLQQVIAEIIAIIS